MSGWERLTDANWREMLIDTAERVTIHTCYLSVGRDLAHKCFYRVETDNPYYGESVVIQKASGNIVACNCDSCGALGEDLYEWFSIYKGLEWVQAHMPTASIELRVSHRVYPYAKHWFYSKFFTKGCDFLNGLSADLNVIPEEVSLEVLPSSDNAKSVDVIEDDFEFGDLRQNWNCDRQGQEEPNAS
jgi:hypothetical protein